MLHSDVVVKNDMYCLSYILQNDQMFFQTGYKVLQSQEKNGFIKCTKVIYNGKDKLVYDISKYKSLEVLLPSITPDIFILIVKNLIDVIVEVNNNGFMQYKNIEIDFNKVFVDSKNYKVYLIYLPINSISSSDDYVIFEKQLKNNLINAAIQYPNIASPQLQGMLQSIKNEMTSIEMIKEKLNNITSVSNIKPTNTSGLNMAQPVMPPQNNAQQAFSPMPVVNQAPNNQNVQKKRGGLFSRKEKKAKKAMPAQNPVIQPQCEGGATEILDDGIFNTITLVGLNTPTDFQVEINKPEFFIGKKADSVNACINFNNAISRVHCKIITINNEYFIVDLGSANGTYVNGYKLLANQQVPIKAGDKIKLANSEFIVK